MPKMDAGILEATALEMYQKMIEIRLFEKRVYDLFLQNLVKGTTHLGTGQEAVAAGVSQAMNDDDYMFTTYRGHNHVLARGTPMTPVMAELLGRENGLMHGKGGSMHLLDVSRGILGAYAIIGAQLVIANGSAWSAKYRGTGQVTVCFLGDGATNIGAFHEALNLAAIWELPVVFVCENNQYMEYTPIGSVTPVPRPAADRAASYGLEGIVVDGNDVEAVYQTAQAAIDRARANEGPSLIEAITYRHGGHSRADPGKYRPATEVLALAGPGSAARLPQGPHRPRRRRGGPGRDRQERQGRRGPRHRRGQGRARAAPGTGRHQRVGRRRERLEELMAAAEVVMPRMGETVDEGTVNEWFKQVGDPVTEGEPLLEIGTDKVDTEIPAPVTGVLTEIRVQQGETVPVATVIAVIS